MPFQPHSKKSVRTLRSLPLAVLFATALSHATIEGSVGVETRYFTEKEDTHASMLFNPQWLWNTSNNQHQIYIEIFSRYDENDDERNNIDITEALWTYTPNNWELSAGIGKVFWGVTESNHLVDIINQTDMAESTDGEAKLGQPMLKASSTNDWGIIDFYLLPYFRERRFSQTQSPLGLPFFISENALYESSDEDAHLDFATRYSHYIGNWDFGISYFKGTNRSPTFITNPNDAAPSNSLTPTLTPYYNQLTQVGLTLQATLDAWLWKLEAVNKHQDESTQTAVSAGFEYTLYGVLESAADVGLLSEYNYDNKDELSNNPLQNDLFIGTRITLNNVQDTNFLLGISQDLDYSRSKLMFIEANRRIGESFRLTLDARIFSGEEINDPMTYLNKSDYLSLELEYFF